MADLEDEVHDEVTESGEGARAGGRPGPGTALTVDEIQLTKLGADARGVTELWKQSAGSEVRVRLGELIVHYPLERHAFRNLVLIVTRVSIGNNGLARRRRHHAWAGPEVADR